MYQFNIGHKRDAPLEKNIYRWVKAVNAYEPVKKTSAKKHCQNGVKLGRPAGVHWSFRETKKGSQISGFCDSMSKEKPDHTIVISLDI